MFKNKKFAFYTIVFCILGLLMHFFYSGLQTDHMNILTPFLSATYGWSDFQITNPVTYGNLVVIVFYLVCGILFVKFGVKKILIPCTVLVAVGLIGLAYSNGAYGLYAVSAFIVRVSIVPFQMGTFMLSANWFIKYRGRVLGFITIGGPLFSVLGINILTRVSNSVGIQPAYVVLAAIVAILAVCTAVFIKDTPEKVGLYPDGSPTPPVSEKVEAVKVTLVELLKDKRAWQLVVTYGILQFVICAVMPYNAVRFIALSSAADVPNLWVAKALIFLSIGAACGIPMSYIFGWIDDKLGTIAASACLAVSMFFAVIPMAIMPVGGNTVLMGLWGFGIACMTGGVATMHPCSVTYVYGRRRYQDANKWIMTIQAIPMAFGFVFMSAFNQVGKLGLAYWTMAIMLVVCLIVLFFMRKIPDANLEDRDYVSSKKKNVA